MNKIDRVRAVLVGKSPDHPPVSFWYHFPAEQACGQEAIDAHLAHLHKWDLDFLKIMNDTGYPRDIPVVATVDDLLDLAVHKATAKPFAKQLAVIKGLAAQLKGKVLLSATVFNAWAVLRSLTEPPKKVHSPPVLGNVQASPDTVISQMLDIDRKLVGKALHKIAQSLAHLARESIKAGADGIFLSVRDDWVDTDRNGMDTYDELVAPMDRMILDAASDGTFNMLHVCGKARNFQRFASYPRVHVVNWADRAAGPSIADAIEWVKPAISAGVDNLSTLVTGSPEDVRREVRDALSQAGDRPIMISPGCTYDPARVPDQNLRAMIAAVVG